jgi:hypothetical protein
MYPHKRVRRLSIPSSKSHPNRIVTKHAKPVMMRSPLTTLVRATVPAIPGHSMTTFSPPLSYFGGGSSSKAAAWPKSQQLIPRLGRNKPVDQSWGFSYP